MEGNHWAMEDVKALYVCLSQTRHMESSSIPCQLPQRQTDTTDVTTSEEWPYLENC